MAGTKHYRGRHVPGPSPDFLEVAVGSQRASVGPRAGGSGRLIIYRIGGRVGRRTAANAIFRFFIQNTTPSSEGVSGRVPANVIGYTSEMTTSAGYSGSNEGEHRWGDIEPVLVDADAELAFGATARNGTLSIGMDVSQESYLHDRSIAAGSTVPQNGYTSRPAFGRNHIYAEGEMNVPPNQPGPVTVSGASGNRRPTMGASFSDPNEWLNNGLRWDRLEQHHHEIWWGGQLRWSATYTATASERTNRRSLRQIGIDVPFDTTVTYFVRHVDRGGLWGPSRSTTFIVQSGATVDMPLSPAAFVSNHTAPGNIIATYRNSGGLNANRFVVQLMNAAGSLIKESPGKNVNIPPGGNLVMTWPESTFVLEPDRWYAVQASARATNGLWSGYSTRHWFKTNAGPNVPLINQPGDGAATATLPDIVATVSHPDDIGIWNVWVEVQTRTGATVGTYNATWVPGTTRFTVPGSEYQGDIPAHGEYRVRSMAFDGHLHSGASPSYGAGTWSQWTYFTYAAVPDVSITAPSSPVSTAQPHVTWTSPNQTHWRVRLWSDELQRFVYNTGTQEGGVQSHSIPSSEYWINGYQWRNGQTLVLDVNTQDGNGIWGYSGGLYITLEYDPIDELIIDGAALSLPGVEGTHYTSITTSESGYPQEDFRGYHRRRVELSGEGGEPVEGTSKTFPVEMNAGNLSFDDYHVASGKWYRYYQWQEVRVGADIIASPEVSIDLMASWYGVLVHSNADPARAYVWLRYGGPGGRFEPRMHERMGRRNIHFRGRSLPTAFVTDESEIQASGEYTFIASETRPAIQQLDDLRQISDWQYISRSPNGRPNGICYRAGRGGSLGVVFVTLSSIDDTPFTTQAHVVELEFEAYDFDPFKEVD